MGRSTTLKYAMIMTGVNGMTWDCKSYGKPTAENLEKYVMAYINSQKVGGSNEHLSRDSHIHIPRYAAIFLNTNGRTIVAEWHQPMFLVV